MGNKKEITHNGIIKSVGDNGITVGIVVQSGCASCQIKGTCNMSEQTDKELDIVCDPYKYRIGQSVMVRLKASQGMGALFLGYVLPFIILVTTMILSSNAIENEGIVGVVSLVSIVPYYIVLYLLRNKIKKRFTYVVNPLN